MRPRGGFTVLELIVVLCIVGIVMVTALPRMGRMLQRNPLTGAATALSSDLRLAQATAGRQRKPVRVSIDTAGKVMRLRDFTTPANAYSTRWLTASSEFPLSSFSASDTTILVYPNGTTSRVLTLTLRVANQQRRVIMTRGGQIRVTE